MNTMSARTIISPGEIDRQKAKAARYADISRGEHRMFVAALSHNANGTATSRWPDRVLNSMAGHTEADRGVPPQYRAQSPRAVAARRMLLAAMDEGI